MTTTAPETMRDHWWWRPGWDVGRRFYTWHLTFDGQPDVHRFAAAYRELLVAVDGIDLVPDRWLHLTTQGIGFVGEIPEADVRTIVEAARERLAAIPCFDLVLDAPVVDPEAILVPVRPAAPVHAVRDAVREAIATVRDVPERADGFTPHISLGYSSATGPTEPFRAALTSTGIPGARARITRAELIVIHRDNRMYEWESYASVPIGTRVRHDETLRSPS
ncbi:2'-5' RNA ligase family protein [Streptomyces sp. NPDC020875]|uniref:2'-5' RNA ligase family protein n=1 Tax=Streptomyces sp. NPDC020875 TaxID=3154898 RepID=UPI0033F719E0